MLDVKYENIPWILFLFYLQICLKLIFGRHEFF